MKPKNELIRFKHRYTQLELKFETQNKQVLSEENVHTTRNIQ